MSLGRRHCLLLARFMAARPNVPLKLRVRNEAIVFWKLWNAAARKGMEALLFEGLCDIECLDMS